MISEELLEELETILKEDYGFDLQPTELSEIALTLIGYFGILAKIEYEGA